MVRRIRISATNISRWLDQNCMRRTVYEISPEKELKSNNIFTNIEIDPTYPLIRVNKLLFQEGMSFENSVYDFLLEESQTKGNYEVVFKSPKDGKEGYGQILITEFEKYLINPPKKRTVFFQIQIPVTPTFVTQYLSNIDKDLIELNHSIIDLIIFDPESGKWLISDIKKSEAVSNYHRYQVTFYTMLLRCWLIELGLEDKTTESGFVYYRNPDIIVPGEQFEIKPFVGRIKSGLAKVLPRALDLPLDHQDWQIVFACEKCNYYLHCSNDSKINQTLSEIPFLTKTAKLFLNTMDVFTLEQAEKCFSENPQLGRESVAISRERDQLKERIKVKRKYLDKLESNPFTFLRKSCPKMPDPFFVEYPIFLSAEKENLYGYTYQISLLFRDRGQAKLIDKNEKFSKIRPLTDKDNEKRYFQSWFMKEPTDQAQIILLKDFLIVLNALLSEIANLSETIKPHNRTVHFFSMDRIDFKNIYFSALKYSPQDKNLAVLVEQLLMFFPPTEEYVDEDKDPEIIWNIPYTIISSVLKKIAILPVHLTLTKIQDVWYDQDSDNPVIKVAFPPKKYQRDRSNQFALTLAYDYWFRNESIREYQLENIVKYKTRCLYRIYWYLAKLNRKEENTIFKLFKHPIKPAKRVISSSDDLEDLAINLITNLPDDDFIRPLNYFRAIEDLSEALNYIDKISGDLEERRILGLALIGLKLRRVELPTGRNKGFIAIFHTKDLNNSKLKIESSKQFLLTDTTIGNDIIQIGLYNRFDYIVENLDVKQIENGRFEIKLKIPGRKDGEIKNPIFRDVIIDSGTVHVDQSLYDKEFILDDPFNISTRDVIKNFLTSFAFQRLGNTFPKYLESLFPENTQNTLQTFSFDEKNQAIELWESNPSLKKISNFNSSQKKAVNSSFQNKLTFVWGPPGTGKTRVIAWSIIINLWYNTLNQKKDIKVAVTAFTNRAIDNALEKLVTNIDSYIKHEPPLSPLEKFYIYRAKGKQSIDQYYFNGKTLSITPIQLYGKSGFQSYQAIVKSPVDHCIVFGTIFQLRHLLDPEDHLVKAHNDLNLGRGYSYVKPTQLFDYVVVDEASQMKVTDFFISAYTIKESGKFLVVGDDKQLSPVVVGEYPDDYKEKVSSIFNYLRELNPKIQKIMLDLTYRFSQKIADFPSRTYYESNLRSEIKYKPINLRNISNNDSHYSILDPEKQVVLITYDGPLRAQDNEFEAEIVAILTKKFSDHLVTDAGDQMDDKEFTKEYLGCITPHNAQINAIKNQFSLIGLPVERFPVVDTVDKYQGQEREIIIISYGVSDPDYASKEANFILSPNRFNVSITRPKRKYILIISENLLEMLPEEEYLLQPALELQSYREDFDNIEEILFKLSKGDLKVNVYF